MDARGRHGRAGTPWLRGTRWTWPTFRRGPTLADVYQRFSETYLANGWKTERNVRYGLRALCSSGLFSPEMRVSQITPPLVQSYIVNRLRTGRSRGTVRATLMGLNAALGNAAQLGLISPRQRFRLPPPMPPRTGHFKAAEVERVIAASGPHLRPIVIFAVITGWRPSEILRLRWEQVDWERGTVSLLPGTTKNGDGRVFPFAAHPALMAVLREQSLAGCETVFSYRGRPVGDIRRAWKNACARAGLGARMFYDLKRTAIRNLRVIGIPEHVRMKLVGHRSVQVHRGYDEVIHEDLVAAVTRLAQPAP